MFLSKYARASAYIGILLLPATIWIYQWSFFIRGSKEGSLYLESIDR